MSKRYELREGSEHECCWTHNVYDTVDKNIVCECDKDRGELIVELLNTNNQLT